MLSIIDKTWWGPASRNEVADGNNNRRNSEIHQYHCYQIPVLYFLCSKETLNHNHDISANQHPYNFDYAYDTYAWVHINSNIESRNTLSIYLLVHLLSFCSNFAHNYLFTVYNPCTWTSHCKISTNKDFHLFMISYTCLTLDCIF